MPVMHNSHGGVSVILREPFKGCGQVTAKQGFGKLFLPEHGSRVDVCASHHLQHSASSKQGVGHGPITHKRSSVVSVWFRFILVCRMCLIDGVLQVIVDGAFTKLYIQWDAAGSDRFVRNCACYLAADMSALDPEAAPAPEVASVPAGAGSAAPAPAPVCVLMSLLFRVVAQSLLAIDKTYCVQSLYAVCAMYTFCLLWLRGEGHACTR